MTSLRRIGLTWIPLLLLVVAFLLDVAVGSVSIPIGEVISGIWGSGTTNPVWSDILWQFRLPKAITCLLAGGGLALGGLQMQTFFRNPLAGPDVLGLSAGASLAVSLLIMGNQWLGGYLSGPWATALAASLGSSLVFIIVLMMANRVSDSASLLIIGLMVAAATASIVSVIQFASRADAIQTYLIWSFGNVGALNWTEIQVLSLVVLGGVALSAMAVKSLNTWILGDNYLRSMGIRLERSRLVIIISTSMLTGGITAFCGPIAFIGIAVPHLTKLLINQSDHRILIPFSLAMGGLTLLLCDLLTQLAPGETVLPLNAVTALVGAPVVIWIILKGKVIRS